MADNTKYHCPDCGRGFYLEPQSHWHTGTPTEEGSYIAHLRIKSRDGKFIEYDMTCNLEVLLNYIRCQDESEEDYLMVKGWFMYEPYIDDAVN